MCHLGFLGVGVTFVDGRVQFLHRFPNSHVCAGLVVEIIPGRQVQGHRLEGVLLGMYCWCPGVTPGRAGVELVLCQVYPKSTARGTGLGCAACLLEMGNKRISEEYAVNIIGDRTSYYGVCCELPCRLPIQTYRPIGQLVISLFLYLPCDIYFL